MATVNKVGSISAGIYTNPNTLSRSMSAAYTALGTQINTLADIFSYNQGAPVQDALDLRWTWNFLAPTSRSGAITSINSGLSGTSVFTYAGDDYQSVNPLFRVVRPGFTSETRPATIYETFLQYKNYIDTTIAAEASRLASLVSTFSYNLVGVDDGSLLVANQSAIAGSLWRTSYEAGVYTLNAPMGYPAKFRGHANYLELAGPKIRIQNYLSLKAIDQNNVGEEVPEADTDRGNLYFSSVDKRIHVIDEDGIDTALGEPTDTGDITFDGIKIIGAGTASSDEAGNGTIELVPDNDLYDIEPGSGYGDGGQYLVIDPTVPKHIHIRAGGPIDEASAQLILGGEKANITVRDQDNGYDENHHVTINTHDNGTTGYSWIFGNDGSTSFPLLDVNLLVGGTISVETIKFSDNTKKSVITGPTPASGQPTKPLILQAQDQTDNDGGDVNIWAGKSNIDAGNIEITAGSTTALSAGTAGTVTIKGGANAGGTGGSVQLKAGNGTSASGEITIENNSNKWTFKSNGNITIPNIKDIQDLAGNTVIGGGNRVKEHDSVNGAVVPVDNSNIYAINTITQATTVTLPTSGTTPIGYEFIVADTIGNASDNSITITAASGDFIISAPSGCMIDTDYGVFAFKYLGNKGWLILYGR